jgi:hypothetical protein
MIPGLLRGHCRYAIAIGGNTILILKNIIITIARFVKFDITLAGIDIGNTERFKK